MFNLNFQVLSSNSQPFDCFCCSSLLSFQHNDVLLTAVSTKLITILLLQQCTDLLPTHCKTRVSPRHVPIPVQSTALETLSPYLSTFLISRLLIRWRLFWIISCWRHSSHLIQVYQQSGYFGCVSVPPDSIKPHFFLTNYCEISATLVPPKHIVNMVLTLH